MGSPQFMLILSLSWLLTLKKSLNATETRIVENCHDFILTAEKELLLGWNDLCVTCWKPPSSSELIWKTGPGVVKVLLVLGILTMIFI